MMPTYTPAFAEHASFKLYDRPISQALLGHGRVIMLVNNFSFVNDIVAKVVRSADYSTRGSRSVVLSITGALSDLINYYKGVYPVFAPSSKVLIIRGIGFRAGIVYNNDRSYALSESDYSTIFEVDYEGGGGSNDSLEFFNLYDHNRERFMLVRVGYSITTYIVLINGVGLKTSKRDRKVVYYGHNVEAVNSYANYMLKLRPPNRFTGRGIRYKGIRFKLKPGKRGAKGKIW